MLIKKLQKINAILLFIFLVILALYYGASILIPFVFASFFAALLVPLSNWIEDKGCGRLLSSFLSTSLLFLVIGIVFYFIFRQLGFFITDLVERKEELMNYVLLIQKEISSTGFTVKEQDEMILNRLSGIFDYVNTFLSGVLSMISTIVIKFLLVLIYVFLLLINRDKFVQFLMMYTSEAKKEETYIIIKKSRRIAFKYLFGRLQVMVLLGIMYTVTFLGFGLEHSLLLILFGVVITIIPYIGPFISGMLPVLFMVLFGGSYVEIVIFSGLVLIIQLIESYVLEPILIGSEVQQSPLFVIVAIVIGGAVWGISGLILFVPIFGIIKIIFDHSTDLKPVGFLIGYDRPGAKKTYIEKITDKF